MSTLRPACGSPRPPRPRRDPRTHQQVTGRPPRHPDHPPNDPEPTTTTKPHPQVLTIAPGGGGTTYPNTSHQKRATRSGSAQSKVTWICLTDAIGPPYRRDPGRLWRLASCHPGGDVGGDRGQIPVGPRCERLAHPRVKLVFGQPSLHESGFEHIDHLLAVGVRRRR